MKKKGMTQEQIWEEHICNLTPADVVSEFNKPAVFQKELSSFIDSYSRRHSSVIEVGCETGITSFLISDKWKRTLLDLNAGAIALASKAALLLRKKASFVVGNMFAMSFIDGSFDLLFNAGVIEHFDKQERVAALREYSRILKPGGTIIIGYPNHYCPPYRCAYLLLKAIGHWRFPSEYKIYDMKEEIEACELILERRITLSKISIFQWLNFAYPVKIMYELLDKIFNYEGYLTVLVISKRMP